VAAKEFQPSASDERVIEDKSFEAELFWAKHGRTILVGAAVAVLVAVGVIFWIISSHYTYEKSKEMLAQASDAAGWKQVVAKFPKSAAAVDARFLLAESLRQQGKVEDSTAVYQDILQASPDSPLAPGAKLGVAENALLTGKTDEALTTLREIQSGNTGGYAAPFAGYLEARILVREHKLDEARKVLSNIVSSYPQSPSAQAAGGLLDDISPVLPPEQPKK